jgi:nicotinamide-nucleotide amidase
VVTRRAGIVVTGTEVLTGRVSDRNGPWLAEQLRALGVDIAQVVVVGDRRQDLSAALGFLAGTDVDLILTTGGLGPTADDLTAEVVADFQGRTSRVDPDLERQIAGIVARLSAARGRRTDPAASAAATRKQAIVPNGATVLAPVGTAPGLIVPAADGRTQPLIVVLPGPPRELQGMWPAVVADSTVRAALSGTDELRQRTMRLWRTPEAELAATLRDGPASLDGLEISTCLRDGELEIVTRYRPDDQAAYDELAALVGAAHGTELFSADGATVDELVATALTEKGLTIAAAESCTAGLLAARLTDRPGASQYVLGGITAYSNAAKHDLLGVRPELIAELGAVSEEVAEAMALGVRSRMRSDIGVGITGVAGPGGGTGQKPVGLVHLCAVSPNRAIRRRVRLPGTRTDIRNRAVAVAMHLLRELLTF